MTDKNNRYGYKVCYKEQGSEKYILYFKTRTYRQAKRIKQSYKLYPPLGREDNHILINPIWAIIPISRIEIIDGIWREAPF